MKTIALLVIAAALASCAGLEIVTHTPYGSGNYKDGVINVTPKPNPIQIPIYGIK